MDWRRRAVVVISVGAFLFIAISGLLFGQFIKSLEKEETVSTAKIISSMLKTNSMSGGPNEIDDQMVDQIERTTGISRAIIFDLSGKIIAPSTLRGLSFNDRDLLVSVTAKDEAYLKWENGALSFFIPAGFGSDRVVVFLEMLPRKFGGLLYFIGIVIFAIMIFGSACIVIYKDIFSLLNKMTRTKKEEVDDLIAKGEDEWKHFMHTNSTPIILLDNQYRLVDMSNTALKIIGSKNESAHLIDILSNTPFEKMNYQDAHELKRDDYGFKYIIQLEEK